MWDWMGTVQSHMLHICMAYQFEFVMESLEILSLAVSAIPLHRGVLVGVVCAEIFEREVIPQCTQGVVLVHE